MSKNDSHSRTVNAIHRTSTSDMLRGPAKAASCFFNKTNTPTGAVVTDRVTGGKIATVSINATRDGGVSTKDSSYGAPCVKMVHNMATNVRGGVSRNKR